MLNITIISLQSVNEWPVFNLKKHIDKHSKITASKDSLQYLIRLLSSKQLLCSPNIWNFYYVIFIPVIIISHGNFIIIIIIHTTCKYHYYRIKHIFSGVFFFLSFFFHLFWKFTLGDPQYAHIDTFHWHWCVSAMNNKMS